MTSPNPQTDTREDAGREDGPAYRVVVECESVNLGETTLRSIQFPNGIKTFSFGILAQELNRLHGIVERLRETERIVREIGEEYENHGNSGSGLLHLLECCASAAHNAAERGE